MKHPAKIHTLIVYTSMHNFGPTLAPISDVSYMRFVYNGMLIKKDKKGHIFLLLPQKKGA